MATKFTRTAPAAHAAKKTVVKPAPIITPTTAVETPAAPDEVEDESVIHSAYQRVHQSVHKLLADMNAPTWRRQIISAVLGIMVQGSVFYGLMQAVDMLCLAAIAYSGTGFLAFMCAFLGILAALIISITAGSRVYEAALAFDYPNVKARVKGWFTFGAKPLAA